MPGEAYCEATQENEIGWRSSNPVGSTPTEASPERCSEKEVGF
ncbi:hypothetical protein RRSWK_05966 [Rhodopirellula sp. SWK7]|nr:hypothetical protein RRSWK_05966 [Rhodopirellula sp. SWK7]